MAKSEKNTPKATPPPPPPPAPQPAQPKAPPKVELNVKKQVAKTEHVWSEMVIKEIMFQKKVSREEALEILNNPTAE